MNEFYLENYKGCTINIFYSSDGKEIGYEAKDIHYGWFDFKETMWFAVGHSLDSIKSQIDDYIYEKNK
jgi:hypothetical protein